MPWTFFLRCKVCHHATRIRGDRALSDPGSALRELLRQPVECEQCREKAAYDINDLERLEGNSGLPPIPTTKY